jgi:MATE family multidrug resistance protein
MPHTFTLPNIRREMSALWQLAWPVLIGQLPTSAWAWPTSP